MAKDLTTRQKQIIALIQRHIDETGFPPTRVEIAKELGFRSANAAEEHLRALHRKGAIEMIPGASRGIRIVEKHDAPKGLPIVGQVAAGNPILAEENIDDYCEVPANLFHPAADFLLRVRGTSMQDLGILDGDLLAVHSTPVAENGQVVVARIDDEVTVKRLKKTRSRYVISLLAENTDYAPISVDLREQQFAIEGVYAGVIRTH
ncbi:MAG: transcriptional repressor LexA [Porticoccaceae bacterium]|nr:transcriptional repressor LexA [Porticoccaceae bacterium]